MADPTVRSNQVGAHTKAPEERLGDYYVTASELYERTTPGHGPVVNKVYRGQKLTVYDIRDDWALVTEPGYQPRWVSFKYLSRTKPALPAAGPIPPELQDSRIVKDAIPKPGEDGHTQHDVDVLWKGAKWILNTGRCASIDYAAKSFNKPGTYFVTCGSRNEFFTEADLKK